MKIEREARRLKEEVAETETIKRCAKQRKQKDMICHCDPVTNQNLEVLMRMEKKAKRSHGMDPVVALALIFVVLKATGLISWSWLWVLSPIWLTYLFFTVIFSAILVGGRIVKGKW